jgi:hypothetical protein
MVKDLCAETRHQQRLLLRAMTAMRMLLYSDHPPTDDEILLVHLTLRDLEQYLDPHPP